MPAKTVSVRTLKINKQQHAKDSEVFGAILAGARASRKKLRKSLPYLIGPKKMCAVGAGTIGKKANKVSDVVSKTIAANIDAGYLWAENDIDHEIHINDPVARFAKVMEVSPLYVAGVNDGFEEDKTASEAFLKMKVDRKHLDYLRGYAVGIAVAEVFCG